LNEEGKKGPSCQQGSEQTEGEKRKGREEGSGHVRVVVDKGSESIDVPSEDLHLALSQKWEGEEGERRKESKQARGRRLRHEKVADLTLVPSHETRKTLSSRVAAPSRSVDG
jgi:hypothetical protein